MGLGSLCMFHTVWPGGGGGGGGGGGLILLANKQSCNSSVNGANIFFYLLFHADLSSIM